jgi:hypothetical protein
MNYGDPFYFFNSHAWFFTKDSPTSSEQDELTNKEQNSQHNITLSFLPIAQFIVRLFFR